MKQIFEKVTRGLVENLKEIEAGKAEARWFRPWESSGMPQFPTNQLSGIEYRGMNALLLHMSALGNGFRTNRWVTFKQKNKINEELDASMVIRKGEHGFPIFKYVDWIPKQYGTIGSMPGKVINTKTGVIKNLDEARQIALRSYTVFNIDQMERVPVDYQVQESAPDWEARYHKAHEFVQRLTCPVAHSEIDKAFYSPSKHLIRMPMQSTFRDEAHYLSVLFHEHVHSTGKELERDMTGSMGDDSYAREELVAEIGAAILCAHYGIEAPIQHPEYIHGYIKQLEDSDRAFWNAANKAQKAVSLLTEQSVGHNQEEK